jgi:hypothetical protein
MTIDALLALGALGGTRIAPASITCAWADYPEERVRMYLAAATRLSEIVNRRLDMLHASPSRRALWSIGPEDYWFGEFSEIKIDKVRRTFRGITRHLSSPRLKVICDANRSSYGAAHPAIEKITLGRLWRAPNLGRDDAAERVQTFVHEASHISGRFSIDEKKTYGRQAAHELTRWRMRATRNADNYGYYALDVLECPSPRLLA